MKKGIFFILIVTMALLFSHNLPAAQFNITPSIAVEQEYNDNIFLAPDNEEDDWITRTLLGIELDILGRTMGLEANYTPSYAWYKDFSEFDGWSHDAFARLYKNFSPNTSLELTNSYLQTKDALSRGQTTAPDDPLVPSTLPVDQNRRGRQEQRRNASTIRLDHRFGAEDTVYAAFLWRILRGLESPNLTDDQDEYRPLIGGSYWFTNFWGIAAEGYYSKRDYDVADDREEYTGRLRLNRRLTRHLDVFAQYNQTTLDYTEGLSVDYDFYSPSIGFDYQLDQNTRIDIAGGWYWLERDDGDDDDDFIVNATADKVWPFRRGLFGITLLSGYDIDDKGTNDNGINIYYAARLRTEYAFTPRFNGLAGVGYRYDDFPRSEPDNFDRQTLQANAGIEYQALRWLFLNMDYQYRDRRSDRDNEEYTENRVIFSITIRRDQPYRWSW